MEKRILNLRNCQAVASEEIPLLPFDSFYDSVMEESGKGSRVISFWADPKEDGRTTLYMVLAHDREGRLAVVSTPVKDSFQSLTPRLPQVHWFEREIFEQWAVRANGHPWLKPIRFHSPYRQASSEVGGEDLPYSPEEFLKFRGGEVHEVAVGPVHAGVIEPGHFRFQCHGEHVLHLEISLGYQHRGVERALVGGPNKRTIHYMETLAGDTTAGHSLAYCHAVEGLSGCNVPLRGAALRGIILELERLANHTGDLGALANDIGYLPTASYCGRLRGDFLNMTALICGNRFGRNMIRPGGTAFDISDEMAAELKIRLAGTFKDVKDAVSLLWGSSSVVDRFDETGIVTQRTALDMGLVGVAARACGLERDVRFDFPEGIFKFCQIPVSTHSSGDVFARSFVRWLEIQRSVEFIMDQLNHLPDGGACVPTAPLKKEKLIVSLTEGWRGEICHAALTDKDGKFAQYKVVDPSFHNWTGLAMALRGEEISDFPICNKSFGLSYCGHDL